MNEAPSAASTVLAAEGYGHERKHMTEHPVHRVNVSLDIQAARESDGFRCRLVGGPQCGTEFHSMSPPLEMERPRRAYDGPFFLSEEADIDLVPCLCIDRYQLFAVTADFVFLYRHVGVHS